MRKALVCLTWTPRLAEQLAPAASDERLGFPWKQHLYE